MLQLKRVAHRKASSFGIKTKNRIFLNEKKNDCEVVKKRLSRNLSFYLNKKMMDIWWFGKLHFGNHEQNLP